MNMHSTTTLDHLDTAIGSSAGSSPIYDNAGLAAHLKAFVFGLAVSVAAGVIAVMISGLPT